MKIDDAPGLLEWVRKPETRDSCKVISFVGAGGKTSAMFRLAAELAGSGSRVCITTTTKMYDPRTVEASDLEVITGDTHQVLEKIPISNSRLVVIARSLNQKTGKLEGYQTDQVDRIADQSMVDMVLVEADGARQKPVKAPDIHEPVIPLSSDLVVGFIGLDSLGLPLEEQHVHRAAIVASVTGHTLGETITSETIARLAVAKEGLFKCTPVHSRKILVLNKADSRELKQEGIRTARLVLQAPLISGYIPDQVYVCGNGFREIAVCSPDSDSL